MSRRALNQLARLHGIQSAYTDGRSERRSAPPEAILAALKILGADVETLADCEKAIRAHDRKRPPLLEPVVVAWESRARSIRATLPASATEKPVRLSIETESGETIEHRAAPARINPTKRDGFVTATIPLQKLASGIHRLTLTAARRTETATLLAAPKTCWSPGVPERPLGLFVPTYALCSEDDRGIGGVRELHAITSLAAERGVSWLGTLPLLSQFYSAHAEASPYSPVSRVFWNELYADIGRKAVTELSDRLTDYTAAWKAQWSALRAKAKKHFAGDTGAKRLRELQKDKALDRYARFRAMNEATGTPWHQWSAAARDGRITPRQYDAETYQTFLFAQDLVRRQLADLAEHGREAGCRLYLDMPLGTHAAGFDAWNSPTEFARGVSMGAPADVMFAGGQNWAITPPHPIGSREAGHAHVVACIREHLKYAGALRVDHVMWMHRTFWIPDGFDATQGLYVRYPAEELYAILCIESHRAKATIVGEDLGTVPKEVRREMSKRGVLGMSVGLFELGSEPSTCLPTPKPDQIACLDTHDTPTLPGFLTDADVNLRRGLDLMTGDGAASEQSRRDDIRKAVTTELERLGLAEGAGLDELVRGLLRHLAGSDAAVLLVNLEDLLGEPLPQNTPGLTSEYPSWRRRLPISIERLTEHPMVGPVLRELATLRARSTPT